MTSAKEKMQKSWNPEDQLESYENELNENEEALNKLREERETIITEKDEIIKGKDEIIREKQKKSEKLKKESGQLKKVLSNIKSSTDDFAGVFLKQVNELYGILRYQQDQNAIFDCDFPDSAKIRKELDERLTGADKIKENLKEHSKALEETENVFKLAKKNRDEKQGEINALKALRSTIQLKLKAINDFKASIEEEAKKREKEHVYFLFRDEDGGLDSLIEELKDLFTTLGLGGIFPSDSDSGSYKAGEIGAEPPILKKAREEFRDTLMKKWDELNKAEKDLKETEEAVKNAEKVYQESQKTWTEFLKDRKTKILEKYKNKEDENKEEEVNNA